MKKVERSELLALGEYETVRDRFRGRVIGEKRERRVVVSPELSVIFENHDTVLLQIQEMLRTERITKESSILHEIETYNELVPGQNELSATMFVEIGQQSVRDPRLIELAGLEGCISLEILGTVVAARNETRGVLPDRTTAVHYVKFALSPELAASLVRASKERPEGLVFFRVDHPKLTVRTAIPPVTVLQLADDLT